MNAIFSVIFFIYFIDKYCNSNLANVPESLLYDVVDKNKLVLAYIKPSEECDEKCQESIRVLNSVEFTLTFLGLKVIEVHSASLLKVFDEPNSPKLFYYRDGVPLLFESAFELDEISEWVRENQEVATKELDDNSFEHLTQASTGSTTGDWFILFYSKKCKQFLPLWETLGVRLKMHKIVAVVNTDSSPNLKKRFKINNCPTAIFLRNGKMYTYPLPMYDLTSLVNFAEGWFMNASSQSVPSDSSPFDQLTDNVASWMKDNPRQFFAVIGILVFLLFFIFCIRAVFAKSKPKLF